MASEEEGERRDDEFSLNHDTHLTRIVRSLKIGRERGERMRVVCSTSALSSLFVDGKI